MNLDMVSFITLYLLWIVLMLGAVGFLFHILKMDQPRYVRLLGRISDREENDAG